MARVMPWLGVAMGVGLGCMVMAIAPMPAPQAAIVQVQSLDLAKPQVSGEATVPLSLLQQSRLVFGLEATIGNQTGQFLLDTGASTTLLSKDLRQQLGLSGTPVDSADLNYAVAGKDCPTMTAARLTLPQLSIGDSKIQGLEALQFDQTLIPDNADGIIGMDILGQFSLQIDPQQRQLQLNQPHPLSLAERLSAIPLQSQAGVMLGQLHINNQGPFKVLVDTGAGSTFISPTVADAVGIAQGERKPIQMLGFCGLEDAAIANLSTARLGPHRQANLEAVITNSSVLATLDIDGVLGQNFLQHYHQTWHFPQQPGGLGFLKLQPLP